MKNDFTSIDLAALDAVTGGTHGQPHNAKTIDVGGGSSSSSDSRVLATLQDIQRSLNDLSHNNGGLFGNNSALILIMAMAMSRRGQVYSDGASGNWGWRASW